MERFSHGCVQFLAFLQPHPLHHFDNAVGAEQPHQIVLERNEKVRRAGVALARATAAQLAVNAPRFVPFRAHDVQAAEVGHAGPEFDVRAAAGHVGGNGHRPALAGARDNFGLLLVVFRVEDGMDDAFRFEHPRKLFADFHGNGADQNGPALGVDVV